MSAYASLVAARLPAHEIFENASIAAGEGTGNAGRDLASANLH